MNRYISNLSGISIKNSLIIAFISFILLAFNKKNKNSVEQCKMYIEHEADSLIFFFGRSLVLIDSLEGTAALERLKDLYFKQRKHYKHIECFVEYYSPHDAKYFINGPLVKKSELEYGKKVYDPRGFQVIESLLFAEGTIDCKSIRQEYIFLTEAFRSLKNRMASLNLDEGRIMDMVQFQLYRIACLNLNGYDATVLKNNPQEAAWALEGCRSLSLLLIESHGSLKLLYEKAITTAAETNDNITFNRLEYLVSSLSPLYKQLVFQRKVNSIAFNNLNYALNLQEEQFFGNKMFNSLFFSVNTADTLNNERQAELGKLLFFDPLLSGNNKRSCASCHQPGKGLADGMQKGISFGKDSFLLRNTPSLWNTTYQRNFFLDGRSRQAEQQISDVLHNKNEMNTSVNEIIKRLNTSDEYREMFKEAFKGSVDTSISYYGILKSISEFEKKFVSNNSRFDKYLRGDCNQMNRKEKDGYNLFTGKAQCATCHFMPLFTGLVPPYFNDTEYEVIGVPISSKEKKIDPDEGRIIVSKSYIHKYAFKATTVRNIELTAPYMHNGVYKTLDEVLDFYNNGGGNGMGMNLENQTLPFDSLKLTKAELSAIKSFMLTLTDISALPKPPGKLPVVKDPVLNKRKIGGEY